MTTKLVYVTKSVVPHSGGKKLLINDATSINHMKENKIMLQRQKQITYELKTYLE